MSKRYTYVRLGNAPSSCMVQREGLNLFETAYEYSAKTAVAELNALSEKEPVLKFVPFGQNHNSFVGTVKLPYELERSLAITVDVHNAACFVTLSVIVKGSGTKEIVTVKTTDLERVAQLLSPVARVVTTKTIVAIKESDNVS